MKLKDLILNEETTTSSVAGWTKSVHDGDSVVKPISRSMTKTSMFKYLIGKKCTGCDIIKQNAWTDPTCKTPEITCGFCGTVHKKH